MGPIQVSVVSQGEHEIKVDHSILGESCGLLPVGIDSTVLSTSGLKWNLSELLPVFFVETSGSLKNEIDDQLSSFEGLVSTSNHLVPGENIVWIKTSKAIWWTAELKDIA